MTASVRSVVAAGRSINVEVFGTGNAGQRPGILFLHEAYGITAGCREDAADLASRGYFVWLPDLYTGGARTYCVRAMVEKAGRENRADSGVNAEIHDLLDALKEDPACNGRLGMLGACLTGGHVIQMACRPDMEAPVVYHHSLGLYGSGVPAGQSLNGITRLQGHWSSLPDPFCPARKRNRLIAELGDRVEAHTWPIPHGFRSVARGTSASEAVWSETLSFFDRHLHTAPTG